jgi:hypothetical protein
MTRTPRLMGIVGGGVRRYRVVGAFALVVASLVLAGAAGRKAPADPPAAAVIDASTLRHKVICGYQGWFRCPGDAVDRGWRHWSRNPRKLTPETLSFEMWPDVSELTRDEKYPAPGFTFPDGTSAHLFSSANPKTVERHFRWMKEYGIDGAFLQRFLVELGDPSTDTVLGHVRAAAEKTGRVYAICYDLTGAPKEKLYDQLTADWKQLVDDKKVTKDARYLRHNDKPVVFVWGFYSDRFGAKLAKRIIDFFKSDTAYAATLIGGCEWYWRTEPDEEWGRVFRRFDVISPWNVGNVTTEGKKKFAATDSWEDDLAEARKAGMAYLPVVYPGFAWTNLMGKGAAKNTLPRLGGEVFWRQFVTASNLGAEMVYVAMFDEVDEGTAIFKVTNTPPKEGTFATYDGLPSDWYLRLTGAGARVIRGEKKAERTLPIKP